MTRDEKYQAVQQRTGYQLDELKIGGNMIAVSHG